MSLTLAGQTYRFGPYQLTLPDGWSGQAVEGTHEVAPDDADYAILLSGFQRDTPLSPSDLSDFAADRGAQQAQPVTLPSGLAGLVFDTEGTSDDPTEAGAMRVWLIADGSTMIVATLTCEPADLAAASLPAQMVIGSIRHGSED